MNPLPKIPAVVLAGGQSRRMGGQDKSWMTLHGTPLILHVLQRIEPQVSHCILNVNRNPKQYEPLGWPVLNDSVAGFSGPLQGFITGLSQTDEQWVLFVPCDMPLLPDDLVSRLWQAAEISQRPLAVVHDGHRLQPVVLLLHRSLLSSLETAISKGRLKVGSWVMQQEPAVVDYSDQPDAFINLNRPEELAALEQGPYSDDD